MTAAEIEAPIRDRVTARPCAFSDDRIYRFTLWREWDANNSGRVLFVGLNPSTADETRDDPTIRRCIGYAKAWGFGGLCMANIFAFRATDPAVMKAAHDPIGVGNDAALFALARTCHAIVACWGTRGAHRNRGALAWMLLRNASARKVHCLGTNADGSPKHPLYLRKDAQRVLYLK